jgi:transposase
MSFQGKYVPVEFEELIVRIKKHYDDEREKGKFIPTRDPAGRTAATLGIGVATVKRIMARYARAEKIVKSPAQKPGRPPNKIFRHVQPVVRQFIRSENLDGRRVSIDRVRNFFISELDLNIPKTNLWRALNRWGFAHGEGRRRDSLKEKDYVILARRKYLRAKLANRNPDGTLRCPEVYLDETYINRNHSCNFTWYSDKDGPWVNKPSGVGPRFIIVHAMTKDGWIEGSQLVFEAKKRTGDYHGQMNWDNFSKWFRSQLLPNVPPRSIIILDNARYHNVLADNFPQGKSATKEQLRCWLSQNDYPWREDMLKSELSELCNRLAPAPQFRLDLIAAEQNISILRTPPYHPELQPIETCWAVVKNHMADNCDFTMEGLRTRLPEAFAKVTPDTCKEIIGKVAEQEKKYWTEDEKLDEEYAANSEEEYESRNFFEEDGLEYFLDEV